MYKFKPNKEKTSAVIALVAVIVGILFFAISAYLRIPPIISQVFGIALIVFGVQIMQRYVLSDFTYIIDDKDGEDSVLNVVRTQGKNSITVCSVSLYRCVYIDDVEKYGKKADNSFDYSQNLKANKLVLIYNDDGKNIMIKLEVDENFKRQLLSRLNIN